MTDAVRTERLTVASSALGAQAATSGMLAAPRSTPPATRNTARRLISREL